MPLGPVVNTINSVLDHWGRGPVTLDVDYNLPELVDILCESVYRLCKDPKFRVRLFLDEFDAYCHGPLAIEHLELVLRKGRSRGISVYGATIRPALTSLSLRSGITYLYVFQTNEPRDLDWCKSFGFDLEAVKNLNDFEYLVWRRGHGVEHSMPLDKPEVAVVASPHVTHLEMEHIQKGVEPEPVTGTDSAPLPLFGGNENA